MNAGIIAMLKKFYQYCMVMKILEIHDEQESRKEAAKGMKQGEKGLVPLILDSMNILKEMWSKINSSNMKDCWKIQQWSILSMFLMVLLIPLQILPFSQLYILCGLTSIGLSDWNDKDKENNDKNKQSTELQHDTLDSVNS